MQFIAWIKFVTVNQIKDLGAVVVGECSTRQVATPVRRFLLRPGGLYLHDRHLIVQLCPFRGDEVLEP